MSETIIHRGPDGSGIWSNEDIALGHRRLSILDLSDAGRQPMSSADKRWVLTYNGEFYNFQEERSRLKTAGCEFRGNSDTEVLVALISERGFEEALKKVVGMFAIAAWDRKEKLLYLARDRFGQKPLYFGNLGEYFIFGSEIRVTKALDIRPEIEPNSLALMLRYKAIPAPYTVYRGIQKLPQASWTTYNPTSREIGPVKRYWHLPTEYPSMQPCPDTLSHLFEQAVSTRMVSDVPLGAFLSGGIDSSLTVAAMRKYSSHPVKTFTIGFADGGYDEAAHAAAIAERFETEHTELRLTASEVLATVPQMASIYDEPFGDSSQIPTYLVSKLAREKVTVALSGDGGDEFFAGYNRHVWVPALAKNLALLPNAAKTVCASLLDIEAFRHALRRLSRAGILPVRLIDDKLDKLQFLLRCRSIEDMYRGLLSDWNAPSSGFNLSTTLDAIEEFRNISTTLPPLQRLVLADINLYLPEDILTKVDRASMAVSLEARSPFLDHRLAEYALSLKADSRISGRTGKYLLRQVLARELPSQLFERPKMGFAIPIDSWLRKELKDWALDLIHSHWTEPDSIVSREAALSLWQEHLSGVRNRHHEIWNVLMLISWLESNAA